MKVVSKIRIKVPFSSSEEADAPRDESFVVVMKPMKISDAKRQQEATAAFAKAVAARQKLEAEAEANGTELAPFDEQAPYNYLADKVLGVEGLEGEDEKGGDLSDPLIARAFALEDTRMAVAITLAVTESAQRSLKTGN